MGNEILTGKQQNLCFSELLDKTRLENHILDTQVFFKIINVSQKSKLVDHFKFAIKPSPFLLPSNKYSYFLNLISLTKLILMKFSRSAISLNFFLLCFIKPSDYSLSLLNCIVVISFTPTRL